VDRYRLPVVPGTAGARSPTVQTIMKRPGHECADLAELSASNRFGGRQVRLRDSTSLYVSDAGLIQAF
jgi:hypothetical protein